MKKKSVILVLILFIITAATACIYLLGRDEPSEGCLTVLCEGNSKTVDPFSKGLQPVSGVLINGKGEEKEISAEPAGIFMYDKAIVNTTKAMERDKRLEFE